MDVKTIEKLQELFEAAKNPFYQQAGVSGYFQKAPTGELEFKRFELEPIKKITCGDLATLCNLIVAAKASQNRANTAVYVSGSQIVAVSEDPELQTRYTYVLPLPQHPIFSLLKKLLSGAEYNQKTFDKLVRAELKGFVSGDVALLARNIKATSQKDATSNIGNGHAAISKSVLAEVKQANGVQFPDHLIVTAPVFDIPESRAYPRQIELLLNVGVDEAVTFEVQTVYDTLQTATLETLEFLRQALSEKVGIVPVYLASF